MDATSEALRQVIGDAELTSAQVEALAQGLTSMITLAAEGSSPSGLMENVWSGTLQQLPGGMRLLMLEAPDGAQGFTLRLDETLIPYAGEWESGGAAPMSAEFHLTGKSGVWSLLVRDENQERAIPLANAAGLRWGREQTSVRLFAPTGAALGSIAPRVATHEVCPVPAVKKHTEKPVSRVPPPPPPPPPEAPVPAEIPAATTCGHCGQPMSAAARFCGHCGKPRGAHVCAKCGQPLATAAAKFCGHCGAPVS